MPIPAMLILAHTDGRTMAVVGQCLLGIGYCVCAAVLWPSIQFLVPRELNGTANGVATSLQMLGIGICNIVVGQLMDSNKIEHGDGHTDNNYVPVLTFFTFMGVVSAGLAVVLCVSDLMTTSELRRGQRH